MRAMGAVGALALVIATAGCGGEQSNEDLQAELDEEFCTLSDEEQELADLFGELEDGFSGCEIEVRDDVVTLQLGPPYAETDTLEELGTDRGWWNGADVQRMGAARALDGTLESADGKTTWTYHPDNGLRIVVDR